jgi:hypothetical protein
MAKKAEETKENIGRLRKAAVASYPQSIRRRQVALSVEFTAVIPARLLYNTARAIRSSKKKVFLHGKIAAGATTFMM